MRLYRGAGLYRSDVRTVGGHSIAGHMGVCSELCGVIRGHTGVIWGYVGAIWGVTKGYVG